MPKYERLQILRFVAAMAVVLHHAEGTAQRAFGREGAPLFFVYGVGGVDLFFVLSGFIISVTIRRRSDTALSFLRRRAERIIPLYWMCTLGFFVLLVARDALLDPRLLPAVTGDLVRSLAFLGWTASPAALPLMYVGWTLEYEMMFYLLTAIGVGLVRRPTVPVVGCLAVSVVLGRFTGAENGNAAAYFLCNPILIEFLFGILVARLLEGRRPWLSAVVVAMALATIPTTGWGERVWLAGLPGAAFVLIAAVIDRCEVALSGLGSIFARLGDASYSIYLVQVFTIIAGCKALALVAPGLPLLAMTIAIAIVTIAIAYPLHLFVERPVLDTVRRLGDRTGRLREA
jgi:exopolysaccharide production protein ExoZ